MIVHRVPLRILGEGKRRPAKVEALLRFEVLPTSDCHGRRDLRRARHHRMAATPAATAMATASSRTRAPATTPPPRSAGRSASFTRGFARRNSGTVQRVHRAIRVFVIGHFNEGEPRATVP